TTLRPPAARVPSAVGPDAGMSTRRSRARIFQSEYSVRADPTRLPGPPRPGRRRGPGGAGHPSPERRTVPAPRLSPAATLVLAVLREAPMHPYEILVRLRKRRDDRLVRLNPGAVYHAVDRLERDGLVERAGVDRDGNRPERTVYAIT